MLADTLKPPYYAVIFSSIKKDGIGEDYAVIDERLGELVKEQLGFLGIESASSDIGVTISYWTSLGDIKAWKQNKEHLIAQKSGRSDWYKHYRVRIAKVEREYKFDADN